MTSSDGSSQFSPQQRPPWVFAAAGSCLALLCMGITIGGLWLFAGGSPSRSSPASSGQEPPAEIDPASGEVNPPSAEIDRTQAGGPDPAQTAIPAPESVGSSGPLLDDQFEAANESAVPLFGPESMEFSVSGGTAIMTARNPGVLAAMYDSPSVSDFVATLHLLVPAPVAGAGYGMLFRSDDTADGLSHYFMLLVSPADRNVALSRWGAGGFAELARAPFTPDTAGRITLVVRAQGGHLEVEVDGQRAMQVLDAAADPGIFGLAMLTPVNGDLVIFESFKVEAPAP